MKKRLTITLDKNVLEKVDQWSKKSGTESRSSAIQSLLKEAFGSEIKKALVLAGGKNKIDGVTDGLPKPMVKIKNKPVLEWQIELLKKYGIDDIIFSIGFRGDKIKEYFGDGSKWGVKISYIEENKPLGTAGPLAKAKHLIKSTFIMLYGDNLFDLDIEDMAKFHFNNRGKMTMALKIKQKTEEYGNVLMKGNRVVGFQEKPKNTLSNLVSAGFFILEPEVIDMSRDSFSFEREVVPGIIHNGDSYGYVFVGQWNDLESKKSYKKASKEWMEIGRNIQSI